MLNSLETNTWLSVVDLGVHHTRHGFLSVDPSSVHCHLPIPRLCVKYNKSTFICQRISNPNQLSKGFPGSSQTHGNPPVSVSRVFFALLVMVQVYRTLCLGSSWLKLDLTQSLALTTASCLSPDHVDFHALIKLTDGSNLSVSTLFDKNSSSGVIELSERRM